MGADFGLQLAALEAAVRPELGTQRLQDPSIKEYTEGYLKEFLKGIYKGSIRELRSIPEIMVGSLI